MKGFKGFLNCFFFTKKKLNGKKQSLFLYFLYFKKSRKLNLFQTPK